MITNESKAYLKENEYIWDERKLGVCKHLSDDQAKRFLLIAKEVKPSIEFQIRECQDCIDALVYFVFTALEREEKKIVKP